MARSSGSGSVESMIPDVVHNGVRHEVSHGPTALHSARGSSVAGHVEQRPVKELDPIRPAREVRRRPRSRSGLTCPRGARRRDGPARSTRSGAFQRRQRQERLGRQDEPEVGLASDGADAAARASRVSTANVGPSPVEFDAVDAEERIARDRQLDHRGAILAAGRSAARGSQLGHAGRDEVDAFETQLLDAHPRPSQGGPCARDRRSRRGSRSGRERRPAVPRA